VLLDSFPEALMLVVEDFFPGPVLIIFYSVNIIRNDHNEGAMFVFFAGCVQKILGSWV
jgi:hypothetical protein